MPTPRRELPKVRSVSLSGLPFFPLADGAIRGTSLPLPRLKPRQSGKVI